MTKTVILIPVVDVFLCLHLFALGSASLENWMSLGISGANYLNTEALLLGTTLPICQQITGLSRGQQKLCMLYTDHMMHVGRGARQGIAECQYQFQHQRWNCSTVDDSTVFGPILSISSKEAAFANGVTSAGVVYSIARGCRDGQLDSCGCSSTTRPQDLKQEWGWGGCGDNIQYGYKFSKNFIDIRELETREVRGSDSHGRQLMNIHNNEVGRRAVVRNMKVTCKCHGVSGSCSLVTCWHQLSNFRVVGDFLQKRYKAATRVKITRRGRLRVKSTRADIPTATDLVYLEPSPDYCIKNDSLGTFGTHGRTCHATARGSQNCQYMCCDRGHSSVSTVIQERCQCKFHWCCRVECQTCDQKVQMSVCH